MFIYLLDIIYKNGRVDTLYQADNENDLIIFIKKYLSKNKPDGKLEIRKVIL